MKLSTLLIAIMNDSKNIKRNLTGCTDGKIFENSLIEQLTSGSDFVNENPNKLKQFKSFEKIKKLLSDKSSGKQIIQTNLLNEMLQNRNGILFYQPLGSQNFPDILLVIWDYIIPFETKFSKKNGDRPTWNSNLPHDEGIYMFGSKGRQDITFFNGMDIMSTVQKKQFTELVKKSRKNLKEESEKISDTFTIYLRDMNNQKISSFESLNRKSLETKTIELLKLIGA